VRESRSGRGGTTAQPCSPGLMYRITGHYPMALSAGCGLAMMLTR